MTDDLREPVYVPDAEEPERYSQTLLSKSDVCEFAAHLYVQHGGGTASHAMNRGSIFHGFAERWLRKLVAEGQNVGEPEEAKTMLDEVAREMALVVPGREQDGLRGMAHNFADMVWIDPAEVVAVEDKFDVELGGRTVTGKIDLGLISGALGTIWDWKTSYNIDPAEDFVGNFQTSLYAVAFAKGRIRGEPVGLGEGITVFDVRNGYPRYAWDAEGTLAYRSEIIDYAAILDLELYLERLVGRTEAAFAAQKFQVVPGSHCNTCPAASECPLPARLRDWQGDLTVSSPLEDAQRVATRWWFKHEGRARVEDAGGPPISVDWDLLKAWVGENGPLRFGADLILEFTDIEKEELRRGKNFGKENFRMAVEAAAERGAEFKWEEWYRKSISTRLTLRTLSPHELQEEAENGNPTDE